MGIDLGWCHENRNLFQVCEDRKSLFTKELERSNLSNTVCLRFIDPYGDTTFNSLQIPILLNELRWLGEQSYDSEAKELIADYIQFIQQTQKAGLYIKFIGD